MTTIIGKFRTTGMRAVHSTDICKDGEWLPIDSLPESVYEGRDAGFETYSLDIDDLQVWAVFYRSNRGNERVEIFRGGVTMAVLTSFERANIWAKKLAAGELAL